MAGIPQRLAELEHAVQRQRIIAGAGILASPGRLGTVLEATAVGSAYDAYDGPFAVSVASTQSVAVKDNYYANVWNKSHIDRKQLPDAVLDFSQLTDFRTSYYVILRMGANGIELGCMKSDEWHAYVITRIAEVFFNEKTGKISKLTQLFDSHLSPGNIYTLGANGALAALMTSYVYRYAVQDRDTLLMFYYDGPGACLPISDTKVSVKRGKITSSYGSIGSSFYRTRENTITSEIVTLSLYRTDFDFCWHEGKLLVIHENNGDGYTPLCRIASFKFDGTKMTSAEFPLWPTLENNSDSNLHLGKEYSFSTCNEDGLFFTETSLVMEWYDASNVYVGWCGKHQKLDVSNGRERIYFSSTQNLVATDKYSSSVGGYLGTKDNYNRDQSGYSVLDAQVLVKDEATLYLRGVTVRCGSWTADLPALAVPWQKTQAEYVSVKVTFADGVLTAAWDRNATSPRETADTAYITILRLNTRGRGVSLSPEPYQLFWRCF